MNQDLCFYVESTALCAVHSSASPKSTSYSSADDAPSPAQPPTPSPRDLSRPLRCASSCVAPSDPTVRNTCAQKRTREQLVSGAAKEVCFVDGAKCCC